MCGIEVHQQLAPGNSTPANPASCTTSPRRPFRTRGREPPSTAGSARRRRRGGRGRPLRGQAPSQLRIRSVANAGLIELDERPLLLDSDAVDVTLTVAALLEARPVDLMQTMRKTVVDGSNTSGFQRTTWSPKTGPCRRRRPVGVDVICLEEDSARKLSTVDTDPVSVCRTTSTAWGCR